jgi:23S rRNA G2445 N2-methylase RlmL
VEGALPIRYGTQEYDERIDEVMSAIEAISEERCEARLESITNQLYDNATTYSGFMDLAEYRLSHTREEVERLYRDMGRHFRSLAPWQVYIITSHEGFERFYGKKADKVRKLYNGMLPCYLYQYFKNEKPFEKKP